MRTIHTRPGPVGLPLLLGIGLLLAAVGAQAQFPSALDVGELPAGKSIVITYRAQIEDPLLVVTDTVQDQGLFDGTNFTAVLTNDPDSPAPDDPTVTPLDTPIDLQVSKTESGDPVAAGGIGNLTYVVSVFNDGPGDGTNVTVSEALTLPPGVSIDSITPSAGSYAPPADPNGTWTFDVANQATETLTVVLTVGAATAPGTDVVSDTATVTGADQDLILPGDDTATESTSVITEADLSITKTDSPDPVVAGTQLIYTVTVENLGPSNALGVVVTDTLPAGVSNPTTVGCVEDAGGTPSCTLGTINANTSKQYTITVDVDPNTLGVITNDASVVSSALDPDTGNNTVSEDTTIQAEADLSITKTDSPDPVIAGGQLTYTVTVENLGPSDASGVIVTDTLPAGVSNPTTSGCVEDGGGTPACTLGTIAAGTSKQYTITVDVDSDTLGVITNSAGVSSDVIDPNGANDVVSEDTTVTAEADLSITKIDDLDPILPGETLTYTVTVQNAGPSAATNVVVTDTLPAGPTLVQTVGCAEDPGGVPTCTLGTIPASGSAQYTIEVSIPSGGMPHTLTNQASVSSDATDPVPGNDSTSEDTLLELGDYGDAPDPLVATAGEYPTLVANDGARHIVPAAGAPLILGPVIDTEPDGQPSAGADGDDNDGTDDEDGVVFTSSIVLGLTATVDVEVTGTAGLLNAWIDFDQNGSFLDAGEQIFTDEPVAPGTQGLSFAVPGGATLGDTYARFRLDSGGGLAPSGRVADGEVEDYLVTLVPPPVLGLTKDDGGASVFPGDIIIYDLLASNAAGAGTAVGVTLTDSVPVGTTFNAADSTGTWSCPDSSPAGTVCTRSLPDIPGGGSTGGRFSVRVIPVVPAGLDQISNDATADATNGSPAMASDTTPVTAQPDMAIGKDDGGIDANPGDVVVYTLGYLNNGNQDATGVVITDTVPADSTFDGPGSTPGWSCLDGDPAGTVCTFAAGPTAGGGSGSSVDFAVEVDEPFPSGSSEIDNTASIADDGTNGPDPNPGDNTGSDQTPVVRVADLSVTKTGDIDPILPGETLSYTIEVTNSGPNQAIDVVATDTLPAGVTLVQTTGCAEDPNGVPTCSLGDIAAGSSASYTIEVTVDQGTPAGTLANSVSVTLDGDDPDPSDNDATEETEVLVGDYGDLPDPLVASVGEYPTSLANDGARHLVPAGGSTLNLGALIDTEVDGQPTALADGDDLNGLDDEDGVAFVELQQGQTVSVDVTVTGTAGLLNAWIDFNQNGVLTDAGEQVFTDAPVTPGLQTLTYPVPATAGLGDTYARFRLDVGGGLAPTGRTLDGEVEDYLVTVVPPPVLSLVKDDGGATALPGGVIVYTLTAGNAAGSGTAFDVTLSDTVPPGTTFNEAASGGAGTWSCPDGSAPGTVCTRTLADIPGGDGIAVPFAVTVDDPLAEGIDQIDNTASLDASNSTPVPASDSTPVDAAPDLDITKDDGGISGFPGGVIPYALDVVNNGNQGATGVEVSDTVPDDTVFNEAASGGAGVWSCADGSPAGTICVHSAGTLDGGGLGAASVTFAVTVDNPYTGDGFVDNTAEVEDDGTNGPDQNPADNTDSDSTPVALDFGDAPPPYPTLLGDDGARHVDAGGLSLGALIDIEVDGLPTPNADGDDTTNLDDEDGVVFASPTVAGNDVDVDVTASAAGLLNAWIDFNADGDWTDAGEQVFADQAVAAGPNTLVVAFPTAAEPGDTFSRWRISTAGGDGLTGLANDGEVEDHSLTMLAEADLVLEKEDIWDPRMAGQPQTYILTVTNDGPSLARATEFEDTFPPETEFIAVEPGAPMCTGAAGVITCELGDLAAGEEMEVRFDVFIDPTFAGTMINDASATSTALDPDPSNNDATEDTTILALMDLETLPDINDNGSSEVAVLEAGSLKFTVVDGDSGDVISSDTFQPDFVPIAMSTVPHFAGHGMAPELAILAKRPTDGAVSVFLRDSRTGELLREHILSPDYTPLYLETVPSFGDSAADELAVLGRRLTDNMPRVFIHDADTGTLIRAFNYPQPYFPLDLELVPDFDGGGVPELAVPGRRATDRAVLVTMKDAATAATASQWFTDHTFLPIGVGLVPAWDGGVDRLSILGRRSTDGAVRLFVRKVTDGTRDVLYGHPLDFLPVDLEILIDFAGPVADESSVLRWRPSDGDGRSSQKDSSDGSFVSGMRVDPTYLPVDLEVQPDWIQTLADELAVLGIRLTDGDLTVFLFDGNGAQIGTLSVP